MINLENKLKSNLKNARRIAVLGVGSELRADDAAGLVVAEYLQNNFKTNHRQLKVFLGATSPENLTGEIKNFKPTHLIIIDSADIGAKAGTTVLLKPQALGGISFCTHQLPLQILADYLVKSLGCKIIIIGIQPKTLTFGCLRSKEVEIAISRIVDAVAKIINLKDNKKEEPCFNLL
ncbi:MAG: hydrogenase 3 maturation endopeptidase HyCI [Candidatus Omnitrophota bacterium]|nr:hydrogenase 3 maturation endopeptidase HyCI [Candidatus Omnitrophota bacterium]